MTSYNDIIIEKYNQVCRKMTQSQVDRMANASYDAWASGDDPYSDPEDIFAYHTMEIIETFEVITEAERS